jgi:hypothetical protein
MTSARPHRLGRHVALHEAGHAVAYWHHGLSFRYVTMRPRQPGVVAGVRTYPRVNDTPAKLIACMGIAAAGRIAQFHCFSSIPRDDAALLAQFAQAAAMKSPASYWDADIRQFVDAGKALDGHGCGPTGPDGWLHIWRGAEEKITGDLWPAVEAVGSKLMVSTHRLTYGEVAEIAAAATTNPVH